MTFDPESFHLPEHGDSRQRKWSDRILPLWPHYERLWQRHVVPLTFAVVEPGNYFVRPTLDERFEDLADTQYAVFFHLAQMHEWCVLMKNRADAKYIGATESLYAFFSHGTSMLDATRAFARAVDALVTQFGGTPPFEIDEDRGDPADLGPDWGMKADRAQWKSLCDRVRAYRNLLVHHRPVFMQNEFVPRPQYVEAMSGLTAISRLALDPSLLDERYEPVVPVLTSTLEDAARALDVVWLAAIRGLETADGERMLADMLRVAPRDKGLTRDKILGVRGKSA